MKFPSWLLLLILVSLPIISPALAATSLTEVRALINEGKFDKALSDVDDILAEEPENIQARFTRGIILTRMNRLKDAEIIFLQLINDHPELPEPYNNLAVIYASQGKYEKANEALKQAINTHPSYATAHENMGDIYAKMASQAYNQALELDNTNEAAREKLSLVNELFSVKATGSQASNGTSEATTEIQKRPVTQKPEIVAKAEPAVETALAVEAKATVPVKAPPEYDQVRDDAMNSVRQWAISWTSQDIDKYISSYSPDYNPYDMTREEWLEQRKERLKTPEYIKVTLSKIDVNVENIDRVNVNFLQKYESDTYSDTVMKTLMLNHIDGRWLIVREESN
jgi:tetratricopeptide (TPR) repeat protein